MNDALLIFTKIENKIGNQNGSFLSQPGRKILIQICAGYSPLLLDGPPNISKKATPRSKVDPMLVPTKAKEKGKGKGNTQRKDHEPHMEAGRRIGNNGPQNPDARLSASHAPS